jgi:hypothetical protein
MKIKGGSTGSFLCLGEILFIIWNKNSKGKTAFFNPPTRFKHQMIKFQEFLLISNAVDSNAEFSKPGGRRGRSLLQRLLSHRPP